MDSTSGAQFEKKLIELQKEMGSHLGSEELLPELLTRIGRLMECKNVLLLAVHGESLGSWGGQTLGWKVKSYSLDVARRALKNPKGYHTGGTLDAKPSESQVAGNILSCVAAAVCAGNNILGVLYCDFREGIRRFTAEDGERLRTIADCCAVYVAFLDRASRTIHAESAAAPPDLDRLLVGETPAIRRLKQEIRSIASIDASILILGETGTGKEVIANAIHSMSPRSSREFIPVHCAAVNAGVFESDLFGHERGAFSGAHRKREGKILQADGGTLFLDELGDIPPEFQTKLLRVLDTKKVTPVGSDFELAVDFRLVCATNKDLKAKVGDGTFRDDLLYRVSDIQLKIPPLRDRSEDIPLLARSFAHPKQLTSRAIQLLLTETEWPGNVRQLKKVVETAVKLTDGYEVSAEAIARQMEYQDLLKKPEFSTTPSASSSTIEPSITFAALRQQWQDGQMTAAELENLLYTVYRKARNNWSRAGKMLGLATPEEIKGFRNWVYYLHKSGTILSQIRK